MSNTLSQIPEAVAAAGTLLTVYFLARRGHGREIVRRRTKKLGG